MSEPAPDHAALIALEDQWRKRAQSHEDKRHVRDDPYDDIGYEHSIKAKLLRDCADALAALRGATPAGEPATRLMRILQALEKAWPPPSGQHHVITVNRYGSDESGWSDKLGLHLWLADGRVQTFFLDDADLSAPSVAPLLEAISRQLPAPPEATE